jgi:thymidine kinase
MITVICGPMFSGKSSMLINYERRLNIAKKNYLTVNHTFDNRYVKDGIATHDKVISKGKNHLTCSNVSEIYSKIKELKDIDTIIIDEAQFFNDISQTVNNLAFEGYNIICAGLNSDYAMKPFKAMSDLFAIADKIIHLQSTCVKCGSEAPFTKRLTKDTDVIVIGESDVYEPRCRKCMLKD